jgi:hypothetical protein
MLMPANHEVDTILVEQWYPFLADSEVRAVEQASRPSGQSDLSVSSLERLG